MADWEDGLATAMSTTTRARHGNVGRDSRQTTGSVEPPVSELSDVSPPRSGRKRGKGARGGGRRGRGGSSRATDGSSTVLADTTGDVLDPEEWARQKAREEEAAAAVKLQSVARQRSATSAVEMKRREVQAEVEAGGALHHSKSGTRIGLVGPADYAGLEDSVRTKEGEMIDR